MNATIAIAQIDSTIGDLRGNVRKHVDYVKRAADGGADLVVFPELSMTGYSVRDIHWEVAIRPGDDKKFGELVKLSKDISIIVGGVEESPQHGLYNAAFFLEKGRVRPVHRKLYPPTYGMFEELRYFSPGKSARAFDTLLGRFGVLICEDLWHLPLPYLLAKDNASVIVTLAASPTRLSGREEKPAIATVNAEHHRTYARLLSSYILFCNRVGFEDGVNFWGGSEAVGPDGETIVRAKLFEEDLVFAEVHEDNVRRARRLSRHFLDDDETAVLRELQRIIESRNP